MRLLSYFRSKLVPILRPQVCIQQRYAAGSVTKLYTELNYNSGIKKLAKPLKSFDLEFQPFIEEINAKEQVIREYADVATMERVRSTYSTVLHQSRIVLGVVKI